MELFLLGLFGLSAGIGYVFVLILIAILIGAFFALFIYPIWNWLLVKIFGWKRITFFQAILIYWALRIIAFVILH